MKNYIIYAIKNEITGKFYIGRTTQDMATRFANHIGCRNAKKSKHLRLYKSIRKYGTKNFSIKKIDTAKDFTHLKWLERFYITYYNSMDEKYGYNMSLDTDDGLAELSSESIERRRMSIHKANANRLKSANGIGVRKTRGLYYSNISYNNINYGLRAIDQDDAKRKYDMLAIYFYRESACVNDENKKYSEEELIDNYKLFEENRNRRRTSKLHGVSLRKNSDLYCVNISKGRKNYFLGSFRSETEAGLIYDKALFHLRGKTSNKFNFPEKIDSYIPSEIKDWFTEKFENVEHGIGFEGRIKKYFGVVTIDNKKISVGYNIDKRLTSLIRDAVILHYHTNDILNNPAELEEISKISKEYLPAIISKITKYTGVTFIKSKNLYTAIITINKKYHYLGSSKTAEGAAILYDKMAVKAYGVKATTNFPITNYIT